MLPKLSAGVPATASQRDGRLGEEARVGRFEVRRDARSIARRDQV